MKTVIIGDIHGESFWKEIVEKEKADLTVFVGDYFDSFNIIFEEQISNYRDIISYSENNKCVLLLGNHDIHYILDEEEYSGYQKKSAFIINSLLDEFKDKHQMAFNLNNEYLITHAGVTETWFLNSCGGVDEIDSRLDDVVDRINKCPLDMFRFIPFYKFGMSNPYGDNIYQSPIWVRPDSLHKNDIGFKQIVGHTTMPRILFKNGIHFIDNKEREYLVYENGNMTIRSV